MNRRILVVDDEPAILDAYRGILTIGKVTPRITSSRNLATAVKTTPLPVGDVFDLAYVSSGEQALEQIKLGLEQEKPFVGGFFDVKLGPGIDGIELIRQAKLLDPKLLVVLVTAYQDRSIEEISKIFGEDFQDQWDLLSKPFTHNEILQKARHIVSDWNRRQREVGHLYRIESQQQQLIESERVAAVGTLARSIGHEFGNILLRIIGKADLALESKSPQVMEDALKIIASSAERAGVIVRNLQSMVQIQAKRDTGSLKGPIQDSLSLIGHELKKNGIELILNLPEDLPEVPMNKVEVGQVLLNLIINAMHSMEPNGGRLQISSEVKPNEILIHVKDTGCGIPKENLEKIFEPLFTTKEARGSGLGLSVSRKILENHNGQILVKSELGKGTAFTLVFPRGK